MVVEGTGGQNSRRNGGRKSTGGEEDGVGGGIPKGVGVGRNRIKFCSIVQYFTVGKAYRGRNHYVRGRNWEYKVQREVGSSDHPPSTLMSPCDTEKI